MVDKNSYEYRIQKVIECPDNYFIPRIKNAGKIFKNYQLMHNGLKIMRGSYYPELIEKMLVLNKGVHEPQEERMFLEILKKMPKKATMIELGAYWGFYSMWFNKVISNPTNYLIEPEKENLDWGKKNFKLNNLSGKFIQGKIGKDYLNVDNILEKYKIPFVNILHSDIQGAELEMLEGSKKSIKSGKIDYIFLSTHSQKLHIDCISFLEKNKFDILYSADFKNETYSYDGIIVAKFNKNKKKDKPKNISLNFFGSVRKKIKVRDRVNNLNILLTPILKNSFSQDGEDVLIEKLIGNKKMGFYVDIGANHPKKFNNTYKFYLKGWNGINVDPHPDSKMLFDKYRPKDINLNCGIANKMGKLNFFIFEDSMFSTFSEEQALMCVNQKMKLKKVLNVPVKKLSNIFKGNEKSFSSIDLLTVDTEGFDLEVLKSNNWKKYKPKIICFEKSANSNKLAGNACAKFLKNKGYVKVGETRINLIYSLKK